MPTTEIRTPDQRLRVFVSSTLSELEAERLAAREAIESIHLSPVLFELGARAHPPRDLYRAYLAQSDVFVGIYGARYGWIAPGMEISGLEDEFLLSAGKPRLVYVKRTAAREPRLSEMLARIEADGEFCYRLFAEPAELTQLVARDLALLLAERFTASATAMETPPAFEAPPLYVAPAEQSELLGRDDLIEEAVQRLSASRVVSLTGPGGTGKTSLAIRLAHRLADHTADGVFYVPLAAVRDSHEVLQTIASTLEIAAPQGGADPLKLVTGFLHAKTALLVLDNFEQVLDAAGDVAALTAACPRLRVLVTSRTPLRLKGEREIPVPPLGIADHAVQLFEVRAQAVQPSFAVTDENRATVVAICRRLDGLPLAIELAAARMRVLTPQAILTRLDRSLALLTGGASDMPERHRTLRAALSWSYDLLTEAERATLRALSVFTGAFGLDAAEAVIGAVPGFEAVDALSSLVDKSLLVRSDRFGDPRFHMLETVREFAAEQLAVAGEEQDARLRFARWAFDYLVVSSPSLYRDASRQRYERFLLDDAHVRNAAAWCFGEHGDVALGWRIVAEYSYILFPRMRLREVVQWFARAEAAGPCTDDTTRWKAQVTRGGTGAATGDAATASRLLDGKAGPLRDRGELLAAGWAEACTFQAALGADGALDFGCLDRAQADFRSIGAIVEELFVQGLYSYAALQRGDHETARALLVDAIDLAEQRGANETLGGLVAELGRVDIAEGDLDGARERFVNAVALARAGGDTWGLVDALAQLVAIALAQEEFEAAAVHLEEVLGVSRGPGMGYGLELYLGSLAGIAVRHGDLGRAARLFELVPDGFEDREDAWMMRIDPIGSLRAETRTARRALGTRARCAPDREAVYDEILDLALRVR